MPRVHWTGFGKFHGVADNPSATLAERVAAKFADDSWEVVEVSGEAARDAALNGSDADVVVHLGVAVDYANITLERCAYNDATFRWTHVPASGPPGRHPVRSQNSAQPAPPGGRPGPWLVQVAGGGGAPGARAGSFAGFQMSAGGSRAGGKALKSAWGRVASAR